VILRSGQGQRGTVGATLQPITLRVVDRFANPVAGATVTVSPSQGSVTDTVLATDSAGMATVRWTLGGTIGTQKLIARVSGIAKSVDVSATASIGKASKASFATATATGTAGKALGAPATVTITDAFGNPIVGATVSFAAPGGTLSQAKVKTDAKGRATTRWTLGPKVGVQTLTASVSGTPAKATLEVDAAKGATTAAPKPATTTKPALTKPAKSGTAKRPPTG